MYLTLQTRRAGSSILVDSKVVSQFRFVALFLFPMLAAPLMSGTAQAQTTDCVLYATDYANAHIGTGDPYGDAVSGAMTGGAAGLALRGPNGVLRGAEAGAALGVMDSLAAVPGGWGALYDMAYQMCMTTAGGASDGLSAAPYTSSPCRSSATGNRPVKRMPGGAIIAGSGGNGCN